MHIAILGCGIIGAMIAYELSQNPELEITVIDRHRPAEGATQAALGVLMGAISQKVKGRAWHLREASLKRYETLIPELEAATGETLPFNRQGIVKLCLADEEQPDWESLIQTRRSQGWRLERWDRDTLQRHCPQIAGSRVAGAVYSADDRQLDPKRLTLTLIRAAQQRGVRFDFETEITGFDLAPAADGLLVCKTIATTIATSQERLAIDAVVVTAGLGSTPLLRTFWAEQPAATNKSAIEIRPVLGQAVRLRLPGPLGNPDFQPVITGDDIHLVPLGNREYWVGATVEFPPDAGELLPSDDCLQTVLNGAIQFCPDLAAGEIVQQWSGLRPRPYQRAAPIIERVPGAQNLIAATGHYRNGVLLAPATAQTVRSLIETIRHEKR